MHKLITSVVDFIFNCRLDHTFHVQREIGPPRCKPSHKFPSRRSTREYNHFDVRIAVSFRWWSERRWHQQ